MKNSVVFTVCGLWLAVFSCAFIAQNPVTNAHKKPATATKPGSARKIPSSLATASLASFIDPVCKMALASDVADTAHYAGKKYGFCSKMCKERFHQHPAAYVR